MSTRALCQEEELIVACCHNEFDKVQLLVEKGASITLSLICCIYTRGTSTKVLSYLLSKSNADNVASVVHLSIRNNDIEALSLLLSIGKDIQNKEKKPLHFALSIGRIACAKILLEDGRVNWLDLDENGDSAIFSALSYFISSGRGEKKYELISLCREYGFNLCFHSGDGKWSVTSSDSNMNDSHKKKQFIRFLDNFDHYDFSKVTII